MRRPWTVLALALALSSCGAEGAVVPPGDVAAWLAAARVPERPDGLEHLQGLPEDPNGWTFRWVDPPGGPDASGGTGLVRGWKNGESRARVEVALVGDRPVLVRAFPQYRGDEPLAWLGEHTLHPSGGLAHYLRRNTQLLPEWELQLDGDGRLEHATRYDLGLRSSGRDVTDGRESVPRSASTSTIAGACSSVSRAGTRTAA